MRFLVTLLILLFAQGVAHADLILTASDSTIGKPGPAGLLGTYFHEGSGTTGFNVDRTIALMQSSKASGTFVSTAINYSGSDASTVTSFLGNDRVSFKGATPAAYDLSDAIFHLTGYYYASAPGMVQFGLSHDDLVQFLLGGKVAISSALGNDTTKVLLTAPGYYAVDLVYSNTNYYNVGSAFLTLTANSHTLTSANLVQSVVPEPGTLALLGVGLLACAVTSRRWRAKA